MNEEPNDREVDSVDEEADTVRVPTVDPDFKVAVRKLELPVKPRGVLAE